MKTKLLSLRNLLTVAITIVAFSSLSARDWFVKPGASTSSAGDSWETACNISVITGSNPAGIADGDMVYLSAGTYESSTSKTVAKYISIIGGYPASLTGTDLPTRNLTADSTIFAPSSGGTARCLVLNATTAPGINKFVLDGLHFRGFTMATANGGTAMNITSSQANIEFKNLSFKNNVSLNANGGAIYMGAVAYNITISFDNCNFIGNQATYTSALGYGGAFYCNNGTTVAKTINFSNCTFKNNTAYNRAGALYFSTYITSSITDCIFDSNYCTNATDNTSSGGCMYIAGGTQSNTFNVTRSIFVNSSCTAKGSVFWFNTTPKNYLNMTNCSLIGNYAKRLTSARAAIDADNFTTNYQFTLNGCVLSNYNYGGSPAGKQANKADVMLLSNTPTVLNSTASTFANSILNGAYFSSSNTLDATSPSILYASTGYLDDATIALALSGDLKITDKIVLKKAFLVSEVGNYTPTKIFDVKRNMNFPMTLIADIPADYKIVVNETDQYTAGTGVTINIAASASDPTIRLTGPITSISNNSDIKANIYSEKGKIKISGLENGSLVTIFVMDGRLVSNQLAKSTTMDIPARGFVIVKISTEKNNFATKLFVQ